jgi:hypothetical protein
MDGVSLLRPLRADEVLCPAGTLVNEADVRCGIEGRTVQGRLNPESVGCYCTADYASCSTWLAAKKVEEKGGDLRKILDQQTEEASRARTRKMLREARVRRAQQLLSDPGPEGVRFREKYRRVMEIAERRGAA